MTDQMTPERMEEIIRLLDEADGDWQAMVVGIPEVIGVVQGSGYPPAVLTDSVWAGLGTAVVFYRVLNVGEDHDWWSWRRSGWSDAGRARFWEFYGLVPEELVAWYKQTVRADGFRDDLRHGASFGGVPQRELAASFEDLAANPNWDKVEALAQRLDSADADEGLG